MEDFSAKLEKLRGLVFECRDSLKEFIDNPVREISTTDSIKFVNCSLEYSKVMFQNVMFDIAKNWVVEQDDEDGLDELRNHYNSRTWDVVNGEKYMFSLLFLKGKRVKVDQDKIIDKYLEDIDKLEEDIEDLETEVFKLRSKLEYHKKSTRSTEDSDCY